jgi:F0F1-type ATP synthase epsilon subunit
MLKPLHVTVRDTENIIFKGDADRVSSFNEVGTFDVLPMHANFISIINKKLTIYKNHEIIKELEIGQAIMKVKKDVLSVFLGIEVFTLNELNSEAEGGSKKK